MKTMKRVLLLIGIVLFFAQNINAQCERMYTKAMNYYDAKDYSNAKMQFQKVVNNCDSNKEIAQEYVKLCEEFIELDKLKQIENASKQEQSVVDSYIKERNRLNDRISQLEKEQETMQASIQVAANKMRGQDAIIVAKTETIQQLQDSITNKLLPIAQEKNSLDTLNKMAIDSLLALGKELNAYLESKWLTVNKEKIIKCDSINDASILIEVIRDNLKLVK